MKKRLRRESISKWCGRCKDTTPQTKMSNEVQYVCTRCRQPSKD